MLWIGCVHCTVIQRELHTVCVLLWFEIAHLQQYHSGLLHWRYGNHMISPVPVKQPWMIWVSHKLMKLIICIISGFSHRSLLGNSCPKGHLYSWMNTNHCPNIPRDLHTICVLLWFEIAHLQQYHSGLLHWRYGNHMISPVPVKQPWMIWVSHKLMKLIICIISGFSHRSLLGNSCPKGHLYSWMNTNHCPNIPRDLHTICVLLWFEIAHLQQYHSGLLHWRYVNHMISPVPVKQPWMIWVHRSHESTKK